MDSACWGAVRTVVAVEQLLDCKDRRASRCWTEPRLTVADFLYFAATEPAVLLLQPISVTRMDKKGAGIRMFQRYSSYNRQKHETLTSFPCCWNFR